MIKNEVIIIAGGKGGVGKTIIAKSCADFLQKNIGKQNFICVETDNSNPDLENSLKNEPKIEKFRIIPKDESGMYKLSEFIDRNLNKAIIINTAAGITTAMQNYMYLIKDVVSNQNRQCLTIWPIDRQRHSINMLKGWVDESEKLEKGPLGPIYVFRNLFFGDEEKFSLFNNGLTAKRVTGIYNFPEMNDYLADKMTSFELPHWVDFNAIDEAIANKFKIYDKSLLQRFRAAADEALKPVLGA